MAFNFNYYTSALNFSKLAEATTALSSNFTAYFPLAKTEATGTIATHSIEVTKTPSGPLGGAKDDFDLNTPEIQKRRAEIQAMSPKEYAQFKKKKRPDIIYALARGLPADIAVVNNFARCKPRYHSLTSFQVMLGGIEYSRKKRIENNDAATNDAIGDMQRKSSHWSCRAYRFPLAPDIPENTSEIEPQTEFVLERANSEKGNSANSVCAPTFAPAHKRARLSAKIKQAKHIVTDCKKVVSKTIKRSKLGSSGKKVWAKTCEGFEYCSHKKSHTGDYISLAAETPEESPQHISCWFEDHSSAVTTVVKKKRKMRAARKLRSFKDKFAEVSAFTAAMPEWVQNFGAGTSSGCKSTDASDDEARRQLLSMISAF